jgi:hypothetical protein
MTADDRTELTDAVALALANAKRVERESKIVVRDLARLRDAVKSLGHDGENPTASEAQEP